MKPLIAVKRIYQEPSKQDGYRVLADRLWPRGMTKEALHIDAWAKDLAPSAPLRKWFRHDPGLWPEFRKKYEEELRTNAAVMDFANTHRDKARITLLYAGKDDEHTHVLVLQEHLQALYDHR